MDTKEIKVKRVVMETPYGDRYVLRDSYLNWRGEIVYLWHTEKKGYATGTPDMKVAEGHKILDRETVTVVYRKNDKGEWGREMTADEMIEVYRSAKKYKTFRSERAMYKVQDYLGWWRTLFCVEDLMAARGYITMRRGKSCNTRFRVVNRTGKVVYA